ncbi:Ankyrin repeat protein [Giardia duodenalis]|uniref:Ankyrin repeat protein n=1 Tax=Giardia intestinalis TaxID=5741 RepID=V6TM74_GIAIN|nr:Ankyrin repeat protein [Giardia intestinalis]
MSDQWFSALKRADNTYVMAHLEEYFLAVDEGTNSSLTIAVLYANKEAIAAICNLYANTLRTACDEKKRTAILTSLTQGMKACLRNDEADIFVLLCPHLLSAQIVSKVDMMERAIEASAYSIVELLLRDEELGSEHVEKVLQSVHSPTSAQYNRIVEMLAHRKRSARAIQPESLADQSEQVQIGSASALDKKTGESIATATSGMGTHTLTEEWMARATKSMLQEAVKALQAELLKEQSQSRKYQDIISSILSNEKQSYETMDTKLRSLTEQLKTQEKQLCEKEEEIARLTTELTAATQASGQMVHPISLTLTSNAVETPNMSEETQIKDNLAASADAESICKQMLSEYSILKSNLLTLGLESSIISQNFAKVSVLTEIASTEIQTLRRSCLDAIAEAEAIRDRLSVVQNERDALNTELQQLKQSITLLRQTAAESDTKQTDPTHPQDVQEPSTECCASDLIPLAAHNDVETRMIDTMTIYSYLEEEEGKKAAVDDDACSLTKLIEQLADHGVQVECVGPGVHLRVVDPTRLSILLQEALQQPGASVLYPSEFSVANFHQLERQAEPSNARTEEIQALQPQPQPQSQPGAELEGSLAEAQTLIARLTEELLEKDKAIAELNQCLAQIPLADCDVISDHRKEGVGNMERVACILYQRALCERDKVLRDIEESKESADNPYIVSFVTQRKLNSIIPCEETLLRELFSKACLRHDILHEDADGIWLEVLEVTIQARNYHLSEYLRSKLVRVSNVLHDQCNRGATLHGFVPMNNLAAVYLLAPRLSNIRDQNGRTALMVAAELDQLDIVRVLLPYEAGAQTSKGHTALMMAAQLGYLRIVQELSPLEAHILDQRGRSAIYYATDGSVYKDVNLSERIIEVIQGHVHSNNL